jgi:hypothetical protein
VALHVRRALGPSLAVLSLLLVGPVADAAAEFEIAPEGFAVRMLDAAGEPELRAGAHPDRLEIDFALNIGESTPRDLVFDLPPGLGMSATAVPLCPQSVVEAKEECPPESRVGSLEITLSEGGKTELPLFELETAPGQPMTVGSKPSFNLPVSTELRPGDLGITVKVNDLPKEPIAAGHLELWGVPADRQEGTSIERRALLSAPSSCGPLSFEFRTRSWDEEAAWLSASAETAPLAGCESLSFEPGVGVQLSNPVADSPTGLRTELTMPEEAGADEVAQAQIESVTVEMPAGIGLSAGGAEALATCSDAQLGLGNRAQAQCPPSSRVGSVEFATPAVAGALSGTIFLGEEKPGQRFRVFVVVNAAGTAVKLVATLSVAAGSGRLVTELQGLPPLSITRLAMSFEGGPGALLASPLSCGTVSAAARFVPYGGGAAADASAGVTILPVPPATRCAAAPFAPRLVTATSTYKAGRPASFSSTVLRRQGEQLPSRLSMTLPAGLSARLGALQRCPSGAVAAAACPAASQMGSVFAEIGSGSRSATLHGGLYLTGPYRRAPFGVLIEIPAKVGPFDLGTIAFRGGAELDPRNGRLTVSTDRLPAAIEGVPVRFQSIELSMNRAGLVRNPTNCSPSATSVLLEAQEGATANLSSPFQARDCGKLGFRPAIRMTLLGREERHRDGRPGLLASVRLRPADANLGAMKMSLPAALGFALGGLGEICSHRDAIAGDCPAGSRIGSAQARTPLLDEPLRGAIYVAQPRGDGLPDIWTRLSGGGIEVNMRGKASSQKRGSAIDLTGLPDVPLSSFAMRLRPGREGAISFRTRPCAGDEPRRLVAPVAIVGQNAKRRAFRVRIGMKARCRRGSE